MKYKCVPAPMEIVITNKSSYDQAVRSFADIINKEATEGWVFHSMESITVTQNPGCLAALFGSKGSTEVYNMLIFSNEKMENISKKSNEISEKNKLMHLSENFNDLKDTNVNNKKYCNNCGQMADLSIMNCSKCGLGDFSQV